MFDGVDMTRLRAGPLARQRRKMQYIFQDPFASLSPRMTIGEILTEGLDIQGIGTRAERRGEAPRRRLLRSSCRPMPMTATPTNSRAASASASASPGRSRSSPRLIVADEPVSALDVSIQAQIINLLRDLQVPARSHDAVHLA